MSIGKILHPHTFLSSLSEWVPLSPTLQPLIVLILPLEPLEEVLRLLMGRELWLSIIAGPDITFIEVISSNFWSEVDSDFGCLEKSLLRCSNGDSFLVLALYSCCICSYRILISLSCSCFSLKDFLTSFRFFQSSTSCSTYKKSKIFYISRFWS